MTKFVLYNRVARHPDPETSRDGQLARCLAYAESRGWPVVTEYADDTHRRPVIKFACYGRVPAGDRQDSQSSRSWQLARARALIESRGGVIVAGYFDAGTSRSVPWQCRPRAAALLAELKNPDREFDAVVIGDPHRAFYGNQYGLTFPLFEDYGVPLWVPEVGGPIDPADKAHGLVMSVLGGTSPRTPEQAGRSRSAGGGGARPRPATGSGERLSHRVVSSHASRVSARKRADTGDETNGETSYPQAAQGGAE